MVTAAELLKSLTNSESEGHIVIGIDRHIYVPDALKRIAVQYDHNVETVTFDCPRHWDDTDLSTIPLYINYMLPDGSKASYIANNINVDGDVVHFDWTISNNVTQLKGNIRFLVCAKSTDEEGNEHLHWNSELCNECYISEGMEADESVDMSYPDIVTQLLERMLVVEGYYDEMVELNQHASNSCASAIQSELAAINAKNEVKTYHGEVLDSASEIRNSYANAIKGKASGEIVRVDDVSPLKHDVKVWVHGKNLFNINDYVTETDYSNNKTIYAINADHLVVGKTYTIFSSIPIQWFKISNSATGYSCVGRESGEGIMSYTFVHTRNPNILETSSLHMYINNLDRTAMYDLSIMESMNICLVEGPIVTNYEPYLDPTTIKLIHCKRNMFNVGTASDYQNIGGVTIDGQSIKCTVTSSNSSHAVNTTNKYPSGVYSLRFDYSDSTPRILLRLFGRDGNVITSNETLSQNGYQYNDAYQGFFKNGKEMILTISDDVVYWCLGFVFPVTETAPVGSVTNVYNVRLEYSNHINQYEIYDSETVVPDSDGTCTVTSRSPIMTIFTDTPGTIVEAEYNRDTTKAMTSYIFTEEIKDEIATKVESDMAEVLASLNSYAASVISGGDS